MNLLNIALVARTNVAFGISDKIMVLCGSAFHYAIHQFKYVDFFCLLFSSSNLLFSRIGIQGLSSCIHTLTNRLGSEVKAGESSFILMNIDCSSCYCRFMPFLILSGQLCPPGIEGTLFALFMSINNFEATMGSFMGAGLASVLNISSGSFDNLLLGLQISTHS